MSTRKTASGAQGGWPVSVSQSGGDEDTLPSIHFLPPTPRSTPKRRGLES